jgi:hypothetical protein
MILAQILKFKSNEDMIHAFDQLKELAQYKLIKYDSKPFIEHVSSSSPLKEALKNKEDLKDLKIDLSFKVYVQPGLNDTLKEDKEDFGDIYKIDIDVPVTLESLDGTFNVKIRRSVYLTYFKKPPLESFGIILTGHSWDAVRYALQALEKHDEGRYFKQIHKIRINTSKAIEYLSDLGDISGIFIIDIPDSFIKRALVYGTQLHESEVIRDWTSYRGGTIRFIIFKDKQQKIYFLNEEAAIYSPNSSAEDIKDIAYFIRAVNNVFSTLIKNGLVRG